MLSLNFNMQICSDKVYAAVASLESLVGEEDEGCKKERPRQCYLFYFYAPEQDC